MRKPPAKPAAPPPSATTPSVDEWGIYDPSQAGLPAVYERLTSQQPATEDDAEQLAAAMERAAQQAKTGRK